MPIVRGPTVLGLRIWGPGISSPALRSYIGPYNASVVQGNCKYAKLQKLLICKIGELKISKSANLQNCRQNVTNYKKYKYEQIVNMQSWGPTVCLQSGAYSLGANSLGAYSLGACSLGAWWRLQSGGLQSGSWIFGPGSTHHP